MSDTAEQDQRLRAYLGDPAARSAVGPGADLDRWTPLISFIRRWFQDELTLPEDLDAVRRGLHTAETRLGRPVPESLQEWFLLTGPPPASSMVRFPTLRGPAGKGAFGFTGMLIVGANESAGDFFEVLQGEDLHESWAVPRGDEAADPAVRFTGEGAVGDGTAFRGPLSALLTYAFVRACLTSSSDKKPPGDIGPFAAGVRLLGRNTCEWLDEYELEFEDYDLMEAPVCSSFVLPQGERLLSVAEGDALILFDLDRLIGAIARTDEAHERLQHIVKQAKKKVGRAEREEEKRRLAARQQQQQQRDAQLAEELAKIDGGLSEAELVAKLEAMEDKLRRYERAIVVDMRRHLNAGGLSLAQRLKAAKLIQERT